MNCLFLFVILIDFYSYCICLLILHIVGYIMINVVTYNILSSHLGGSDYFTSCDPNHLKPSERLSKIFVKLGDINNSHMIEFN